MTDDGTCELYKQLLVKTLMDHVPLNAWFLLTQTISYQDLYIEQGGKAELIYPFSYSRLI